MKLISPSEARVLAADLRRGGWDNMEVPRLPVRAADALEHLADLCERQQKMLDTLGAGGRTPLEMQAAALRTTG